MRELVAGPLENAEKLVNSLRGSKKLGRHSAGSDAESTHIKGKLVERLFEGARIGVHSVDSTHTNIVNSETSSQFKQKENEAKKRFFFGLVRFDSGVRRPPLFFRMHQTSFKSRSAAGAAATARPVKYQPGTGSLRRALSEKYYFSIYFQTNHLEEQTIFIEASS